MSWPREGGQNNTVFGTSAELLERFPKQKVVCHCAVKGGRQKGIGKMVNQEVTKWLPTTKTKHEKKATKMQPKKKVSGLTPFAYPFCGMLNVNGTESATKHPILSLPQLLNLSGPLNQLNATLSLLQPLDSHWAPSATGSAIGRPYLAPSRVQTQVGVLARLVLNRLRGSTER